MEVLGAVASAATLAQIAVKGVEFLQKIPEIKSDYAELCNEVCTPFDQSLLVGSDLCNFSSA
jgi:hypothetical protein